MEPIVSSVLFLVMALPFCIWAWRRLPERIPYLHPKHRELILSLVFKGIRFDTACDILGFNSRITYYILQDDLGDLVNEIPVPEPRQLFGSYVAKHRGEFQSKLTPYEISVLTAIIHGATYDDLIAMSIIVPDKCKAVFTTHTLTVLKRLERHPRNDLFSGLYAFDYHRRKGQVGLAQLTSRQYWNQWIEIRRDLRNSFEDFDSPPSPRIPHKNKVTS